MGEENPIDSASKGVSAIAEIVRAAGESDEAKQAASNLGKTAVVLTQTVNNVLLPLAAVNFGIDKAREYFSGKFQKDMYEKTASIPEEHVKQPKASIAGPALQGIAFTHDEEVLKDMFISLIATGMDGRVSSKAHPAFVEIIKQLDADEADILKNSLHAGRSFTIAEIRNVNKRDKTYSVLYSHLLNLHNENGIVEEPRISAMVSNWIRLGLVEVFYDRHITDANAYSWVELRPEYIKLVQEHKSDEYSVTYQRGVITRTEFGRLFAEAVGIVK